jgi:hypothetical protein
MHSACQALLHGAAAELATPEASNRWTSNCPVLRSSASFAIWSMMCEKENCQRIRWFKREIRSQVQRNVYPGVLSFVNPTLARLGHERIHLYRRSIIIVYGRSGVRHYRCAGGETVCSA